MGNKKQTAVNSKRSREFSIDLFTIIATLLGLALNVFSGFTLSKFSNIPTWLLNIIFGAVVLTVTFSIGLLIYRRRERKRCMIVARLRDDEAELFARINEGLSLILAQEEN